MDHILALDQGTTSTRAVLFDASLTPRATAQQEFTQHFPQPGWVEHDPEEIWQTVLATARNVLTGVEGRVVALGLTNQRETLVIWDRRTGQPLHRAIVWQDRRSAGICADLRAAGHEAMVTARTGLLLDPYFTATKVAWLLDHLPGARARAEAGELALGTIDTWLIWKLTGGRVHATDATNASRTMLYDIGQGQWDAGLCALFGVPMALLPEVRDCAAEFGHTAPDLLGLPIPIRGVAGDQQAATVGQACFGPGMMKATYGTGCFALLNTGAERVTSSHRLLTTIAYRLNGEVSYALEGAIFNAGTVVQWLRDGLRILDKASDAGAMAARARDEGVVLVPAFTGLGAPWWRPDCRGAIFGLTRATGRDEMARAALEAVAHQTRDLVSAMRADWPGQAQVLRVDGGMVASDWAMQYLADLLEAPVDRPVVTETTALGAAWLAGLQSGLCPPPGDGADQGAWRRERRFIPVMDRADAAARHDRWTRAVQATMAF